jgi:hypothetical protein
MRISDDRYSRDQLRLEVAMRFIRLEARTQTIRLWTGLTDDRIRKLYRSYLMDAGGTEIRRHRGKAPRQAAYFTHSTRLRQETDVLASVCLLLGLIGRPTGGAEPLAQIRRAQLLCQAFECYRQMIPEAHISLDHLHFLLGALAQGRELRLDNCKSCGALIVADRLTLRTPRCVVCATDVLAHGALLAVDTHPQVGGLTHSARRLTSPACTSSDSGTC